MFAFSLAVVILVLNVFSGSCEQNNVLRCCLFSLMARLLVTGLLVALLKKYVNCIFCRFLLVVKLLTWIHFFVMMKKLKTCFAYVDLFVRLILDII